eukprot:8980125-Pyramimonas_sp.AAC.1
MGAGDACGRWYWGLPERARVAHAGGGTRAFVGAPIWGHETCEGCAEMVWVTHASPCAGAFGGAP